MKNFLLTIIIVALYALQGLSQSVPQGMRYQAVARDEAGKTLDNQIVSLQISLRAGEKGDILYTERHNATTSQLGLFSITIGEGKTMSGEFASIPWNLANIWLDIDMNEAGGKNYTNINSSQLLTVPYAFHAGTAGSYSGMDDPNQKNGLQFYWSTTGNLSTLPGTHYVGTRDYKDFVFKSNNIQRMTILKDGDIDIDNSLTIGVDLRVDRDASIGRDLLVERNTEIDGTLGVDGITTLRNPAESTTKDNGSLIVEGGVGIEKNVNIGGNTEIDGTLGVDGISTFKNTTESTTKDNGSVIVEGGVGIEKNVNIGGNTEIDGTLGVDGVTTLKNVTESTSKDNGSLVVEGGVGIEKNTNIGGNTEIDGTLGVDGVTTLKNTTESTTKDNGSLVVEGGAGVEKNLNVGGKTSLGGDLDVGGILRVTNTTQSTTKDNGALVVEGGVGIEKNVNIGGNTEIDGTLGVDGVTTLKNTTQSTTKDNGSLVVEGGMGIEKNVNIGGNLDVDGDVKFDKTLCVVTAGTLTNNSPNTGSHVALFENTNNGSGIQIKVGAPVPHNNNNFITFLNSAGTTVGRIEGENGAADLLANREFQDARNFMIVDITTATLAEGVAIAEEIQAGVDLAAAAASSTACAGLGVCVTVPIPSLIAAAVVNLVLKTANLVIATTNFAASIANLVVFDNTKAALFGITFASGSEDYAEYLPKSNLEDDILPGEIVGVKHGSISRNTDDAEMIMVVSHRPAVLGGIPADGNEADYEMVAFMGQVPTRVYGDVQRGDYILASGFHNGFGIAKNPAKMKADDYKKILGIAWEGSEGKELSFVNVAVGLNNNDLADVVKKQGEEIKEQQILIEELRSDIKKTHEALAELLPGFREAAGLSPVNAKMGDIQTSNVVVENHDVHLLIPNESTIIYYELTNADIENAFSLAAEISTKAGVDLSIHPFWNRVNSDQGYKESVVEDMKDKLKYTMHIHKKINKTMGFKPSHD